MGILTLAAAAAAAIFAKRAADETKRTANAADSALLLTERISKAQLKPLIAINVHPQKCGFKDEIVLINAEVRFTNLGGTEATFVNVVTEIIIDPDGWKNESDRIFDCFERSDLIGEESIFPRETLPVKITFMKPESNVKWIRDERDGKKLLCIFSVAACYKSPVEADDVWIKVRRNYALEYASHAGVPFMLIPINEMANILEEGRLGVRRIR